MKVVALIPARLHSTRLPRKLIQSLGGRSVVQRTYEAVASTELFDLVFVVTGDREIIRRTTAPIIESTKKYLSGSDRLAGAISSIAADVIVNVQADEPFIDRTLLERITQEIKTSEVDVVSAAFPIENDDDINNPSNVKVYFNEDGLAQQFSRTPIEASKHYQHIGVYAFKRSALERFAKLEPSMREKREKLENLRFLENGMKVRILLTDEPSIGIDTQEDLDKARQLWSSLKN
jgi:3-deoxy-manno-octulosonate cytidylyltransferase (CMP-KDO synthetase)